MSTYSRAVLLAATAILASSAPARAELCPDCRAKEAPQLPGKCVVCGGDTKNQFGLCPSCSTKLRLCEACQQPLPDVRQTGPAGTVVNGVLIITDADKGRIARGHVGQEIAVR